MAPSPFPSHLRNCWRIFPSLSLALFECVIPAYTALADWHHSLFCVFVRSLMISFSAQCVAGTTGSDGGPCSNCAANTSVTASSFLIVVVGLLGCDTSKLH